MSIAARGCRQVSEITHSQRDAAECKTSPALTKLAPCDNHSSMQPRQFLNGLPRFAIAPVAVDLLVILVSLYSALYLRVGTDLFAAYAVRLPSFIPVFLLVRIATLYAFRCYSVMWRYVSSHDALRLAQAIALSTTLIVVITFFWPSLVKLPRSVYFIEAAISLLGLTGLRLFNRLSHEGTALRQSKVGARTLIYGAGENGRLIAQRFKSDPSLATHVVGFVDDDLKKHGLIVNGIPVLGAKAELPELIEKYAITQVLISVSPLSGDFLRDVVIATRPFNIRPRITTRMTPEVRNSNQVRLVRELNLADLLNHPPREIDLKPVLNLVRGKCVLVTGAGGSIGSELARQLVTYEPSRLLLLDHSEFNLYEIDRELRLATHNTERVVPLLMDLKDESTLRSTIKQLEPDIVFHAAAYKHVHLVETNPFSAILNNIAGTNSLLKVCEEAGVRNFVMISTDKAVNPAGTMGATKRVCELLVTAYAKKTGHNFCSTRFGNVLGSSGSLIPLLRQQIEAGGPVTITHKDMTRFFMLIPEAVALVLKAATISKPGDISVLKMGEPIRIVDIAKSMIALMGRTEEEISIVFTGLRPGEKMFEELYIRGDELATEHPDILTLPDGDSAHLNESKDSSLVARAEQLILLARQSSPDARILLNELVKSNYIAPSELNDSGRITGFSS